MKRVRGMTLMLIAGSAGLHEVLAARSMATASDKGMASGSLSDGAHGTRCSSSPSFQSRLQSLHNRNQNRNHLAFQNEMTFSRLSRSRSRSNGMTHRQPNLVSSPHAKSQSHCKNPRKPIYKGRRSSIIPLGYSYRVDFNEPNDDWPSANNFALDISSDTLSHVNTANDASGSDRDFFIYEDHNGVSGSHPPGDNYRPEEWVMNKPSADSNEKPNGNVNEYQHSGADGQKIRGNDSFDIGFDVDFLNESNTHGMSNSKSNFENGKSMQGAEKFHMLEGWDDANHRRSQRLKSLDDFNDVRLSNQSQRHQRREPISHPLRNEDVDMRRPVDRQRRQQHQNSIRREEPQLKRTRQHVIDDNLQSQLSQNKLDLPYNDLSQLQAIQSNAPAILLPSGPGTGKSHVLSLRIAYLLQPHLQSLQRNQVSGERMEDSTSSLSSVTSTCTPDSMVILSFTNRDAERLKERALEYLFPSTSETDQSIQYWKNQTSHQLWSGTMHAFSLAILHKYGDSSSVGPPLRVLPSREMRNRVSASLRSLLNDNSSLNGNDDNADPDADSNTSLKELRLRHLQALNDVGHSRSILYQNIVRCIDLWKEANLPLILPVPVTCIASRGEEGLGESKEQSLQKEERVRLDCVELAMRLGIPESSALLALDIFPEYQARHAAAGTADPSDLSGMAYQLLLSNPLALHLLRSKLRHIVVDEYQDMSVSQHALLRLVVRGADERDDVSERNDTTRQHEKKEHRHRKKLPILLDPSAPKRRFHLPKGPKSYNVPTLFCAGDTSQSIYGWRGAAPSLTVDGFRRDYPQGIVAPLGTCYRLPSDIAETAAMLMPKELEAEEEFQSLSDVSPAAAAKLASTIGESLGFGNKVTSGDGICWNILHGAHHQLLLLSKKMQKLDSTVLIHGLWDEREEAKYIASTIRRRAKQRRKALMSEMKKIEPEMIKFSDGNCLDHTDVAVMVRSSNQLMLLKAVLIDAGIPFVAYDNGDKSSFEGDNDEESQKWLERKRGSKAKLVPMKPAVLMTMHRSKGEEFDDIYLAGWTEGTFPHPDAASANRIHEERRLAYVALTRARQRVVITHSFMSRVLHYGSDGHKRYVTTQLQPSRFLYDLMPEKRKQDGMSHLHDPHSLSTGQSIPRKKSVAVWNRDAGIKDFVAGQNLPSFFQKSYQTPIGYTPNRADVRMRRSVDLDCGTKQRLQSIGTPSKSIPKSNELQIQDKYLQTIQEGLDAMLVQRKKGASKKYTTIFRDMLSSIYQINRGCALVFASGAKSAQSKCSSVDALLKAAPKELTKKALSKCTAAQLGHYLAYLILKPKMDTVDLD